MDNRTLFSSFGKWLAPICTKMFTSAVAECQQDKYTKKLTTTAYLKLFLLAQLQCREGLRHIADDVLCEDLQREIGFTSISASQLSRKHNQVDPELLRHVFERLARLTLSRQGVTAQRHKIKIIDSTTVTLCLQKFKWAEFRKTKAGIKIHLRLAFIDEHEVLPEKATVTAAKKNESWTNLFMNLASRMSLTAAISIMLRLSAIARTLSGSYCSIVHGDEDFSLNILKCLYGLLRRDMLH